jgi:hypothetical protein
MRPVMFQTNTVSVVGLLLLTYRETLYSSQSHAVVLSGFLWALNLLLLSHRRRLAHLPGAVKIVGSDRPIPIHLAWLGTGLG